MFLDVFFCFLPPSSFVPSSQNTSSFINTPFLRFPPSKRPTRDHRLYSFQRSNSFNSSETWATARCLCSTSMGSRTQALVQVQATDQAASNPTTPSKQYGSLFLEARVRGTARWSLWTILPSGREHVRLLFVCTCIRCLYAKRHH